MVNKRTPVASEPLPLVAILIATLQERSRLLALCLECVAAQTYPVDRIRVYRDDRAGVTIGEKRNALWARAKKDGAEIGIPFDDDDYHLPTRVADCVAWFARHPSDLVCGSSRVSVYNGPLRQFERMRGDDVKDSTIAFKAEAFERCRFADTSAGEANDFIRALRGRTGDLRADLCLYMRHTENVSPWPLRGMRTVRPERWHRALVASGWFGRYEIAVSAVRAARAAQEKSS